MRSHFVLKHYRCFFFSFFLWPQGEVSLSSPRDFTVDTVTLPVLRVFHCEICRIRTRDLLLVVWSATIETPHLHISPQGFCLQHGGTILIQIAQESTHIKPLIMFTL